MSMIPSAAARGAAPTGSHVSFVCDVCDEYVSPADGFLQFYNANPELGPVGALPILASSEEPEWPEGHSCEAESDDDDEELKFIPIGTYLAAKVPPLNVGIMVCHERCDPYPHATYPIELEELTSAEEMLDWAYHFTTTKGWMGRRDMEGFLARCRKALKKGS